MIKYKIVTYKRVPSKKSKIILTDVEEDIIKLRDNKIYVTKKSRMIAEARMNDNHVFSQFLVNYYTFVVLALSIAILIIEDKDKTISLLTVIASVGLFGVSLFLSNMSYNERALKYKESYLSLGELESKLSLLLRKNNLNSTQMIDVFEKYQQEYHNILSKTDNHDEIDYIK
ncbi:SLATT domain-containing protein, partial [Bacillus toyonensis]|uniref:SLATT domain-containing protein n=1 Tax=Bacillus toyonensis TaxID=155322 RepID=UPI000C01A33B